MVLCRSITLTSGGVAACPAEAILGAKRTQLRPIPVTSVMLMAGMIPVTLGCRPGSEAWRAGLANMIIGGQVPWLRPNPLDHPRRLCHPRHRLALFHHPARAGLFPSAWTWNGRRSPTRSSSAERERFTAERRPAHADWQVGFSRSRRPGEGGRGRLD